MTDNELIEVLKKFETTRVEKLNDNAKRLFYAITKIADERDNLKEENQRLNNVLNELEKWLKNESKYDEYKDITYRETTGYVLDKLVELKESDK